MKNKNYFIFDFFTISDTFMKPTQFDDKSSFNLFFDGLESGESIKNSSVKSY